MAVGPALTHEDKVFPLNKLTNTIGRKDRITNLSPDVDLAPVDPERAVSRKHAEANYQGARSRSATWVRPTAPPSTAMRCSSRWNASSRTAIAVLSSTQYRRLSMISCSTCGLCMLSVLPYP